jgi:hypothetical protein
MFPGQRRLKREPPRVRHLLRLQLTGDHGGPVVGRLLALAPVTNPVEFALQIASPLSIGGVAQVAFKLLFVIALVDMIRRNVGAAVVPESSEAAAVELKLDQVFLHDEGGDGRAVATANGRTKLL